MRRKTLVTVGAVCLAAAVIYAVKSSVLFRGSVPMSGRRILLMSPLRDRQPERAALSFLGELKTNKCRDLLLNAGHTASTVDEFCAKEVSFAPDNFRLIDRRDDGSSVRLEYTWSLKSRKDWSGLAEVVLTRTGDHWAVVDYTRAY